ncbi:hypothetical protein GDO78_002284 [Eleutherodactylus coqui]|uniref:Uncharacterized protein n=1 Tax=Eleutherodactylus coqui TaxID=57060 RepID=A0A8J6EVJ8_ELECQ|nr:hypothetical protein GDO78_002284 [Eleutherodactylus coqui]
MPPVVLRLGITRYKTHPYTSVSQLQYSHTIFHFSPQSFMYSSFYKKPKSNLYSYQKRILRMLTLSLSQGMNKSAVSDG